MTTLDSTVPAVPSGAAATAAGPAASAAAVRFLGIEREFLRLMIRGAVFLGLTLGIYRFWLTTDIRRFLWSRTELAGETLEYTGTPRELLIGFLIAVAILIPVYTFLFAVALNLGPIGQMAGLIGFVLLTFLGQYAVYRARRYRLTRTVYRGVRFHQTGSAWHYAVCAVFWWVMIGLTLGLLYPLAQARLERFKMRNTHLGDLTGSFAGTATSLFLRGFVMWLLVVGPLIAALVAIIAAAAAFDADKVLEALTSGSPEEVLPRLAAENPEFTIALGLSMLPLFWSFFAAILLYPVFQAMVLRWWVSGLRFGDIAVMSYLGTGQVYGAYLRFIGWSIVFSLLAGIAIAILAILVGLGVGSVSSVGVEIVGGGGLLLSYVVMALGYSTIHQVKVRFGLWRAVVNSIDLSDTAPLARITAAGAPASSVGEGLADALNVGGI